MVYKSFDENIGSWARATSKTGANVNEVLTQELNKPVIEKTKKIKFTFKV